MTDSATEMTGSNHVESAARIVSAFVANPNNSISPSDIPSFLSNLHSALSGLGAPVVVEEEKKLEPPVSIRKSMAHDDYLISLEDGQKYKMLKRHLSKLGMTPDQYRSKWNLPADYPMTARSYTEQRRNLAKKIGLGTSRTRSAEGRKASEVTQEATPRATRAATAEAPKRRGRARNTEATAAAKKPRAKKAAAASA